MLASDARNKAPDKSAHRLGAVPTDDVGRDLVADEVAEDAGMAPTVAHSGGYPLPNLGLSRRPVEKRNVLRPG